LFLLKIFSRNVVKISIDIHRILIPHSLPLDAAKAGSDYTTIVFI
jgi:hypothetical protein